MKILSNLKEALADIQAKKLQLETAEAKNKKHNKKNLKTINHLHFTEDKLLDAIEMLRATIGIDEEKVLFDLPETTDKSSALHCVKLVWKSDGQYQEGVSSSLKKYYEAALKAGVLALENRSAYSNMVENYYVVSPEFLKYV